MNWIAWDPKSYGGALLGAIGGFFAFGALAGAGFYAPWIVGLLIGLGCAAITLETSGMRGMVLAIAAAWVSALADVHYVPIAGASGMVEGLLEFHAALSGTHLWLHLASMLAAFLLGRTSLRPSARRRLAGA